MIQIKVKLSGIIHNAQACGRMFKKVYLELESGEKKTINLDDLETQMSVSEVLDTFFKEDRFIQFNHTRSEAINKYVFLLKVFKKGSQEFINELLNKCSEHTLSTYYANILLFFKMLSNCNVSDSDLINILIAKLNDCALVHPIEKNNILKIYKHIGIDEYAMRSFDSKFRGEITKIHTFNKKHIVFETSVKNCYNYNDLSYVYHSPEEALLASFFHKRYFASVKLMFDDNPNNA